MLFLFWLTQASKFMKFQLLQKCMESLEEKKNNQHKNPLASADYVKLQSRLNATSMRRTTACVNSYAQVYWIYLPLFNSSIIKLWQKKIKLQSTKWLHWITHSTNVRREALQTEQHKDKFRRTKAFSFHSIILPFMTAGKKLLASSHWLG